MARRPALANAAPSCSSSVDLPMPGSPPISRAEPGTMPPPVTRSSSANPVGMRVTLSVVFVSVSRSAARPFDERVMPEPGVAATSASSSIVFHSPQVTHLPAQREATAPQLWHTNWSLAALAMCFSGPLVDPVDTLAEAGEQLIADGAGAIGEVVDGHAVAHYLHPGAAPGKLGRHAG